MKKKAGMPKRGENDGKRARNDRKKRRKNLWKNEKTANRIFGRGVRESPSRCKALA